MTRFSASVILVWWAGFLLALPRFSAATEGALVEQGLVKRQDYEIAHCVIDVVQASLMLGDAGTAINSAVKGCHGRSHNSDKPKAYCSAPLFAILEFLSYTASFIAGASSQCSKGMNMTNIFTHLGFGELLDTVAEQEKCAKSITRLTGGFGQLASAAAALTVDCNNHKVADFDYSRRLRRLREDNAEDERGARLPANGLPEAVESRKENEAECAFDIGQTTLFLARAGAAINSAVSDCSDMSLFQNDRAYRADCAVAISGVIASFSFAASTISFAVSNCPLISKTSANAACAGSVFNLLSGLAVITNAGATFQTTCYSRVHPKASTTMPPDQKVV